MHGEITIIEQFMFSIYPGISAVMLTWAAGTVIPIKYTPLMLISIGFIFQQIFMIPTTSSFKKRDKKDDEDLDILSYLQIGAIAAAYCVVPALLQLFIGIYRFSFLGIFHFGFMVELLFLMSVTVFLTTLMSIRPLIEAAGMQFSILIKIRWISGAIATILCYPYLIDIGISSHFLPWLPAAIAVYSTFGALLGYKKYRGSANICFGLALLFSVVWAAKLPWRITYPFLCSTLT
ncbi:hypothetical protein KUTeg_007286 [Tegillarca granosa]|uniref:Uncharacterized protein n=1 Tax=Tegillarca granosa TaxID=220873 RepID=A0ABQ9FES6_TEGGR|nr:hypothetical protein KUTeg_007286 [Tegillarca granosa]